MLDPASISMIAALVILVILSAFFSATETAFTSLNRIRLKSRADSGNKRAALTLRIAEDYDKLLSTNLIGNNIVNISASTVGTVLFTKLFLDYGPLVSTVVLTVVILVFGEISPKSMAKENAEAFAMFAAPIMRVLMTVLAPVNYLFAQWKKLLSRIFRKSEEEGITEEELITMVDQAENEGGLDQHEGQLIRSAIEFNDLEVEEILTPRVDIVAAEDTATMDEIAAIFAENGYSRLPIYHDTIDNIIGVIHEKDFHAARYHGQEDVSAIVSNVLYTTGSTKISDLLRILQRAKAHMVIVVDEYGGTEGLCTLEDIVEELVGEIWDEHDEVIEEFKKQSDGSYLISCNANLTDLYDLFSIKGERDCTTVSGWVMEEIGRVPEEGDHFVYENLDVTVTRVDHRRVLEIRVVVLPQEDTGDKDRK
ncbi:MAG: HlyC/CorC family transporter [Oscillospiraceae bacterium]|uniref:Hemolysin family protein n=2 Tax=Eubacteriales incertae sedis TaxID=538999 RepID=A0ABS9M4D5_9FIRM|nr:MULTISPECIES: hemolysin family protein [Intestinimonas]MBS6283194.1 HlyC/CorC family transporter [Oscillospiraceae bacterium]CUQ57689.1 putative membrane CBS domain-containing protein [Flavonifractor plautii]SCJ57434.1 Putative Mg2+ and Co2+ transporter CorB [uncultured Flavonifractor sp.]MCG4525657.1 hemolysin family protein [Intestinimonas massiliensis (ex Afouda et al. 2020)]MCI5562205.1 hemolysin family protein [Intestinimonas massiliensis (ex Afouda et al. 2020)]